MTDLAIYRGDTFAHEFQWLHDGQPMNLSDWTPLATMRTRADGPLLATFEVVKIAPASGVFRISLMPAQTAELPHIRGHWDVQFTHADGRVVTPDSGRAIVTLDISIPD